MTIAYSWKIEKVIKNQILEFCSVSINLFLLLFSFELKGNGLLWVLKYCGSLIMKLTNGAEVVPAEGEEAAEFFTLFPAYADGLVRVGPKKCLLTKAYLKWAEEYLNFEVSTLVIKISSRND